MTAGSRLSPAKEGVVMRQFGLTMSGWPMGGWGVAFIMIGVTYLEC